MNYKMKNLVYCLKGILNSTFIGVDIIEENLDFNVSDKPNVCFYDYENDFICNIIITDNEVPPTQDFEKNGKFYYNVKNIKFDQRDAEDLNRVGFEDIFKIKVLKKFIKDYKVI